MSQAAVIYLDHAATTPLRPEAAEAMARAQADAFANPSSQHAAGRLAKRSLEESRELILELLGATACGHLRDRLVFTSGATEANRLAVVGLAAAAAGRRSIGGRDEPGGRPPGSVLVSARDHASIHAAARSVADRGFSMRVLPLCPAGLPDRAGLDGLADGDACTIATVAVVCGQTGIVDDARFVAAALPFAIVHADATQSVAWLDRPFRGCGAATMTLAPHKFGGPRGIGCLVVRHGRPIEPVAAGPQESGLRGGTEPVALAAGFAAALAATVRERAAAATRIAGLRDEFEQRLVEAARRLGIEAMVVGDAVPTGDSIAGDVRRERSPHISTVSFPGLDRQAIVIAADLAGIACSTGTACSSGSAEPSPALAAMPLSAAHVRGAVRFSLGYPSTQGQIEEAVIRLSEILARLSRQSPPSRCAPPR